VTAIVHATSPTATFSMYDMHVEKDAVQSGWTRVLAKVLPEDGWGTVFD